MHAVLLTAGEAFLALLPVVEPFNGTAHFLGLTSRHSHEQRRREAVLTAVTVATILLVFLFAGEPLLHHLGVSLESLQIAGGIVVGYIGFRMVTEPRDPHDPEVHGSVVQYFRVSGNKRRSKIGVWICECDDEQKAKRRAQRWAFRGQLGRPVLH